jgi:HEAT repeat protein
MQCLGHLDIDVQIEAARALALLGEAAHDAVPGLIRCLASKSAILRANAAAALPAIGGPAPQVVPELTRLLQDSSPDVVDAAADGLCRYAPLAAEAIAGLVEALRKSEINCGPSQSLAAALVAIDPPSDILQRFINPIDREIRKLMIRSLRAAKQENDQR